MADIIEFPALKTRRADGPMSSGMLDDNFDRTTAAIRDIYTRLGAGVRIMDIRYNEDGTGLIFVMSDGDTFGPLPIPGGFAIRGPWVTDRTYKIRDLVVVDGTTYVSTTDHVSGVFSADLATDRWEVFAAGASTRVLPPVWAVGRENLEGELIIWQDDLYLVMTDFTSEDLASDIADARIVSVRAAANDLRVPGWIEGYEYLSGSLISQPEGKLYIADEDHLSGATFAADLAAGKWTLVAGGGGSGGEGGGAANITAWTEDTDYVVGDLRSQPRGYDTTRDHYVCVEAHTGTTPDAFYGADKFKWLKLAIADRNIKTLTCTVRGTGVGSVLQEGDWDGVGIAVPMTDMQGFAISFREAPGPEVSASGTIHARRTFGMDLEDTQVGMWSINAGEDSATGNFFFNTAQGLGPGDIIYIEVVAASGIKALTVAFAAIEPRS